MLHAWDFRMTPDSSAALLFAQWFHRELPRAAAAALEPAAAADLQPLDSLTIIESLRTPDGSKAALEALASAWSNVQRAHGPDTANWRWGDVHQMRFRHPLLGVASPELAAQMTYPAYPRGGTDDTVNSTGFGDENFEVKDGGSFRMVLDVGNWDAARMTNAPGQSGDSRSPFYRNLLEGWATEQSFPMLYSESAVSENAASIIRLLSTNPRKPSLIETD
jgi:penicillin amidase